MISSAPKGADTPKHHRGPSLDDSASGCSDSVDLAVQDLVTDSVQAMAHGRVGSQAMLVLLGDPSALDFTGRHKLATGS